MIWHWLHLAPGEHDLVDQDGTIIASIRQVPDETLGTAKLDAVTAALAEPTSRRGRGRGHFRRLGTGTRRDRLGFVSARLC